jgi:hypothetical protein
MKTTKKQTEDNDIPVKREKPLAVDMDFPEFLARIVRVPYPRRKAK